MKQRPRVGRSVSFVQNGAAERDTAIMSSDLPSDSSDPEEARLSRDSDQLFREDESEDEEEEEGDARSKPSSPESKRENSRAQGSSRPESATDGGAPSAGFRTSSSRESLFSWLQNRSVRRGPLVDPARDNFRTMTRLYSSMSPATDSMNLSTQTHGAVFNLEYSPDG